MTELETIYLPLLAWWLFLFGVLWLIVRAEWLDWQDALGIGLALGSLGALWFLWPHKRDRPRKTDGPADPPVNTDRATTHDLREDIQEQTDRVRAGDPADAADRLNERARDKADELLDPWE